MHPLPTTEPEIDAFLTAFESGRLPKERWTHAAHLFTGACYVHRYGEDGAIDQMRRNVCRYNEAVGGKNTETSGYHETITVFWIKLLHRLLGAQFNEASACLVGRLSRAGFAALAVERFAHDREILRRFYDFDVIASKEARRAWIPPTLLSPDDVRFGQKE
jgi:hypothetical protein